MHTPAPKQVLIIGAGLTGSTLTHYLSHLPNGNQLRLTLWERSGGPGGRFSTVRSQQPPGAAIIDDGAQYITRGAGTHAPDGALYDALLSHGVIEKYTGVIAGAKPGSEAQENYVCRDGMSSVAQHLLKGTPVEYERCAVELSAKADRWCVTDTAGQTAEFDAVVVTSPVPQLLELQGEALHALLAPHREALGRVASRYSQRFAACVYYDEAAWAHFEAVPWASAYVKPPEGGSTSLVYVSIEPRKRQLEPAAAAPALLLHSSVPFGFKNAEKSPAEVLPTMLADLDKVVPGLPAPTHAVASRWKISQVPAPEAEMRGVTGVVPGAEDGALLLQSSTETEAAALPPLVLAGDGFVGSNFDNCARSGRAAAAKLVAALFPDAE